MRWAPAYDLKFSSIISLITRRALGWAGIRDLGSFAKSSSLETASCELEGGGTGSIVVRVIQTNKESGVQVQELCIRRGFLPVTVGLPVSRESCARPAEGALAQRPAVIWQTTTPLARNRRRASTYASLVFLKHVYLTQDTYVKDTRVSPGEEGLKGTKEYNPFGRQSPAFAGIHGAFRH